MNYYKSTLTLLIAFTLTFSAYFSGAETIKKDVSEEKESIFDMPKKQAELTHLTRMMYIAMQQKNYVALEKVCTEGVKRFPDINTWSYNLACVQAIREEKDKAFENLEKSIDLGFTDVDHISQDPDLTNLKSDPRFNVLLKKAQKSKELKAESPLNSSKIIPFEPTNGVAMVSEANTAWNANLACFVSYFDLPANTNKTLQIKKGNSPTAVKLRKWQKQGTAAGNYGDFYDNRDRNHSNMSYGEYPYLTRIEYSEKAKENTLDRGITQRIMFNRITLGNASLAGHWSLPRLLMHQQNSMILEYAKYMSNQMYVYPEHKDHDAPTDEKNPGKGDTFPANIPYLIISQGSSGSDRPFLHAVADTLAAFRPETKEFLRKNGVLMPTIQMIFRYSQKTVSKPEDYLKGTTHPTVFDKTTLDSMKMIEMAQAIKTNSLPPVVQMKAVEEDQSVSGRDFFDPFPSQTLFDTPCAIARVMRSNKYEYRIVINAEDSKDLTGKPLTWNWVVLRGDKDRIKINKLNKEGSIAELIIQYQTSKPITPDSKLESPRVDIGVFVNNGEYYSAPGFVSFFFLNNEKRLYDKDNKIISIDYGAQNKYTDPMISVNKTWKDEYQYDKQGKLLGWKRIRGKDVQEFTAEGGLLIDRDNIGRPLSARKVNYKISNPERIIGSTLIQEDSDLILYYWYPNGLSTEGEVITKEEYEKRKLR